MSWWMFFYYSFPEEKGRSLVKLFDEDIFETLNDKMIVGFNEFSDSKELFVYPNNPEQFKETCHYLFSKSRKFSPNYVKCASREDLNVAREILKQERGQTADIKLGFLEKVIYDKFFRPEGRIDYN
jgi:hypothetical protein